MRWRGAQPPSGDDVLLLAGLGLIGWGAWQIAPGLAGLIVGVLLVLLVVPLRRWWG